MDIYSGGRHATRRGMDIYNVHVCAESASGIDGRDRSIGHGGERRNGGRRISFGSGGTGSGRSDRQHFNGFTDLRLVLLHIRREARCRMDQDAG